MRGYDMARRLSRCAGSIGGSLGHVHSVGDFQIVAGEGIDMHHPSEGLLKQMAARGVAGPDVGDFSLEAETAVSEETVAMIQFHSVRPRGNREHPWDLNAIRTDIVV
jgi:hypothetical protein